MKARRSANQATASAAAANERILEDEEERAREARISSVRDRVMQRNAILMRTFGTRISSPTSSAAGGLAAGSGGGTTGVASMWRLPSRQGYSFLRFGSR